MLTNIQTQHHQETPVKKIRRSKLLWQGIIKKYEASGLSQQAFCTQYLNAISVKHVKKVLAKVLSKVLEGSRVLLGF